MNIMLIGPNPNNATDGVIIRGIRFILKQAYPKAVIHYKVLEDIVEQFPGDFFPHLKIDLIVVCGTPWLWDSFQLSEKYYNLLTCFQTHNAKRLFMGAGSCLPLGFEDSDLVRRPAEVLGVQQLFNGATVIVRDKVAKDIMDVAQIQSHLLPCPAYFCYGNELPRNPKLDNVLIWVDPETTISKNQWTDKEQLTRYYDNVLGFYHGLKPTVYCTDSREVKKAQSIGLPTPRRLYNSQQTLEVMRTANMVMSGRVHCAVPARVQGAAVAILAIDTRAQVITDFEDISDFSSYLSHYLNILRSI